MHSVYKTKIVETPIEEIAWGKLNLEIRDKAEIDLTDDDMVTISEGDKDHAAQNTRKVDGHEWLFYCHRPVDIKIVGVFFSIPWDL